jgi:hypothetical protein
VHYVSYFDFFRGKQTQRTEMPDHQAQSPLINITKAGK